MADQHKTTIFHTLLYGVAAFLCAYIITRGICVSMTVDEVCTYDRYVKFGFWEVYNFQTPSTDMLPNNHLLNSWLAHFSVGLFGVSAWSLRLPNLVFACIAVWTSVQLVRLATTNPSLRLLGIGFLFLNAYYLEFFALARGYGMMHSCVVVSVYFLFRFLKEKKYVLLIGTLCASFLATLSIFGALNYFLSISGVLLLVSFLDTNALSIQQRSINAATILVFIIGTVAFIFRPLTIILKSNQIFGGTNGFWKDTVGSLTHFYSIIGLPEYCTQIAIALLCALIITQLYIISKNNTIRNWLNEPLCAFALILILTLLAPVMQHRIGGSPFLVARTALVYIPLWGVCVWLAWLKWAETPNKHQNMLHYVIFAVLLVSFIRNANIARTMEWPFDAFTKTALNDMLQDKKAQQINYPVRIGVHRFAQPSFDFHITNDSKQYNKDLFSPSYNEQVKPDEQFVYYFVYEDDSHPAQMLKNNYIIIKDYDNGYQLYRKK